MSTALSTWKSTVKAMIEKGDSYEKIKAKYPLMSEDDNKEFKIKCESSCHALDAAISPMCRSTT